MVMDNLSRPYSSRLCKWDLIVKPRRLDFPLLTVLDVALRSLRHIADTVDQTDFHPYIV